MDPVNALSVAAAAVQFADITIKITKRIAVFATLHDATDDPGGPKAFVERIRSHLNLLNNTVQRINEGLASYEDGLRDDEIRNLNDYMSNINSHGRRLDQLLSRYLPNDDASIPATLLAALKSIASDHKIKSTMASINELLPLLTTFLTSMVLKGGFRFSTPGTAGTYTEPGQRPPSSGAIYQVSRHEVRHFVDRPEILNEIGRLFDDQHIQSPKIVILQGMGGQGKTQLALRYCANAHRQKQFDYILWIDASSRGSTVRGLEEIAGELNETNEAFPDSDSRIAFVRRKLTTANLSWLLVLDNYDDPSAFDLREYIPKSPLGNVLVTSRSPDTERIGSMLRISGMTEKEATNLLFKHLDISEDSNNRTAAIDIVSRLGYLPLAIDQAGAYMKVEGVPLIDFLSHYEQSTRDIFNSVPSLWEYTESPSSKSGEETTNVVAKTVFTTWNLSFRLLKPDTSTGHFKATVLSLLAFFDEHEILEEYFRAYCSVNHPNQQPDWMSLFTDGKGCWSSRKFDSVMREFSRLSLITALNTERKGTEYAIISLHPLVRDWINLRQEKSMHKENFITFTQLLAAVLLPELRDQSELMPRFGWCFTQSHQIHAHIVSWMKFFERYKSDLHPTIVTSERERHLAPTASEQLIAVYLYEFGLFDNSLELSRWLWESCDVSDSLMLRSKFDAGTYEVINLQQMGLYDEAKRKSREKLQYWTTIFGTDGSYDDLRQKSLELLIGSLCTTVHLQDRWEAIELCKSQLQKLQINELNMLTRYKLLTGIMVAARDLGQNDVHDAILETILNETVRCDENDSWKKTWTWNVWYEVTWHAIFFSNDSNTKNRLSLAALEWAADKSMGEYYESRTLRATALSYIGMFAEGEAMIRACISGFAFTPSSRILFVDAYEALGVILKDQERYEEAYEAYNSALLQLQGPELQNDTLRILDECALVASKFNLGLAGAHWTSRLSLAKKTDDWGDIIRNTIQLYRLKAKIGTEMAERHGLELLVDGLELYGVEFVHEKNSIRRTHLKQINAIIDLNDRESLQDLAEGGMVQELLMKKLGAWYGFDLLIRMAVQLLRIANTAAAEEAFYIAKATFEQAKGMGEGIVEDFIGRVYDYLRLRTEIDRDDQRVQDTLSWARLQVCEKLENDGERVGDWWEDLTTDMMALINPPKTQSSNLTTTTSHLEKPVSRRIMQRLSGGFSRARNFKLPGLSSSQPRLTFRRGLKSVHDVAAGVTTPTTVDS